MPFQGLFVGLTTLDLIYQVKAIPQPNEKVVAIATTMAAGGPATNAAVTFSYLGSPATVLSVVGTHPLHHLVMGDLDQQSVTVADLNPTYPDPPPVSSIFVTASTGDRAVVSVNATQCQATIDQIATGILDEVDVVLIDGHQMVVSEAIAQSAKEQGIPVVVDAGSWKPGFDSVLPWADVVVCSANFHPPGYHSKRDVFDYLASLGVPYRAMSQGSQPILYETPDAASSIPVAHTQPVDTLGAGDVLHGAFCHFLLDAMVAEGKLSPAVVVTALGQAGAIASQSCQSFGTRQWMQRR